MTSTSRNHLSLYLLAILSSWHWDTCVGTQGASTKQPLCSFPSFLQESCSQASKTCRHWSQGRQLEYKEKNAFYERESARGGKGEFLWVFKGGKVKISAVDSHLSRIHLQEFYCWQKIAPHIFIISSENAINKTDLNVKYSCVKFRKRGRNVIEYLQSLWIDNSTNLACNESELITNENPLIVTTLPQQLHDCPAELNGGFQIIQLYNGKTDEQCSYNNGTDTATFESDCLGKEGLMIQLPAQRDCSLRTRYRHAIDTGMFHLGFHCFSTPWKDKQFTYFIIKRQLKILSRSAFEDRTESDFLCARFQKTVNERDEEIQVQFFDKPTCWRNVSAAPIFLILHLRRTITLDQPARAPSEINETECNFPEKFQGIWKEISQQNGLQAVVINRTAVDIPPFGRFHCKRRHFFQHQAPSKCSALVTGKWPGTGRAKFYMYDYLLLSNFSNGCRPRVTRFGITDVIRKDVLTYRLSQSVRISREGQNSDDYFNYRILRQFCSSWLPYMKDPYPIWGRNIEKIVMKNPVRSKQPCLLPAFGKGVYYFKSVYADQSECLGPTSRVQFGCDSSLTFEVKYDPSCRKPDVSFACIGKAWKIGEFSIVQETDNKSISCMWFDKENNRLLRLNSPQCSDIDLGKRPWEERNYAETFVLKYYGKCPITPDTKPNDYPVVIRRRNASHSFHLFPSFIISTCLLVVIMFYSIATEMLL